MNESAEVAAEKAGHQASQALLLARIFASVLTLICLLISLLMGTSAAKFGVMYAELGTDAELPIVSQLVTRHAGIVAIGMLVLSAVTLFFVWSRGKAAAWMAGLGLLLLAVLIPCMVMAMILPLVRILTEMGNM